MLTEIRPCKTEDLAQIARIHKAQFLVQGSLLGHFSPALIAALYTEFLDRSVFLVHTSGDEIDGFVVGGSSQALAGCRLAFFRKHALLCFACIAVRPDLWLRASRSFVKAIMARMSPVFAPPPPEEFRILSIAVAPSATRKGIGTELVHAFEKLIPPSYSEYGLHVLKTNRSALSFYEKLSFQCVGETSISWKLRRKLATTLSPESNFDPSLTLGRANESVAKLDEDFGEFFAK